MNEVEKIRKLVRPFIAFCFVVTIGGLALAGKIAPSEILPITGIIIGFYFGERAAKKPD